MKQRFIGINLHRSYIAKVLVILLFFVCALTIYLFIFPGTVTALHLNQTKKTSKLSLGLQLISVPSTAPFPTASTSTNTNGITSQQDTQAQNDLSISNSVIAVAGVVIAVAGLTLTFLTIGGAIAGFLGFREIRRFRTLRKELNKYIKSVTNVEKEVKEQQRQLKQSTKDLEDKNQNLGSQLVILENRLKQIDQDFRAKRFLEASYYYSEGTNAYKIGDNRLAIEYYKQALELQPNDTRIMERLGRAYSNLNKIEDAIKYLNDALASDASNVPALRSLALCYRYSNKGLAIQKLQEALALVPSDYDGWDFLGLFYRDQLIRRQELLKEQSIIDEAIDAHEKALAIKRRPETEFYLSILLLYSPKGDRTRARELMSSAYKGTLEQEHDLRMRPVWKTLIHAGIPIIDGNKEEALSLLQTITPYITTPRIHDALNGHLRFLLEGTGHKEWIPDFMDIVKSKVV